MTRHILLAFALLCSVLVHPARAADPEALRAPFAPGERLTFDFSWGPFPVATAVLEVGQPDEIDGEPVRAFSVTARTNDFADAFYKVRDHIRSWTTPDMERTVRFHNVQSEGSYKRDFTVNYDPEAGRADYLSVTGNTKTLEILPGTHDPLSIYYFYRSVPDLEPGAVVVRPVSDGKKASVSRLEVVKRERIKVPAGTFDTLLCEPDMSEVGGVFQKSKDAKLQVWVTDDERRIPVKLKSKVVVGWFIAELTRYEPGVEVAGALAVK